MNKKIEEFIKNARIFSNRRSVKYAIPFFTLIIGGSIGLREFTQLRYQFSNKRTITQEEAEKEGITMKEPGEVSLETEYEKVKDMDIENWENKRAPRPWEENWSQVKEAA